MSDTYAVVIADGIPLEAAQPLEVVLLEDAVVLAKGLAKTTSRRWNVYKLTNTHTFPGRPR